jgi:hypothetical protein
MRTKVPSRMISRIAETCRSSIGSGEFSLNLFGVDAGVILKREKGPNRRGQYISRVEEDESRSETIVQEITQDS